MYYCVILENNFSEYWWKGEKRQDLNRFKMLLNMLCDILLLFMYVRCYKSSNTIQTLNVSKVPFALVIPFCS